MKIGDKVLCISTPKLFPDEIEWGCTGPERGNEYTVREVLHGGSGIYVEEVKNPINRYWGGISETNETHKGEPITGEPAWSVKHFQIIK